MSCFGRWLNNTVKEAHERYKQEDEEKAQLAREQELEAQAEQETDAYYIHPEANIDSVDDWGVFLKQYGFTNQEVGNNCLSAYTKDKQKEIIISFDIGRIYFRHTEYYCTSVPIDIGLDSIVLEIETLNLI